MYGARGEDEFQSVLKNVRVGTHVDGLEDLMYPVDVCLDPVRNEDEFGHDRPMVSFTTFSPPEGSGHGAHWHLWGWVGHPGAIPQLSGTAMPVAKWG